MDSDVSRQMIAAVVTLLASALTLIGVTVSPEIQDTIQTHAVAIVTAVMALFGVLLAIFRQITATPMVSFFRKAKGA